MVNTSVLQFSDWLTDRVVKTENPSKQERAHNTGNGEGVVCAITSHICHRGRGVGSGGGGGEREKSREVKRDQTEKAVVSLSGSSSGISTKIEQSCSCDRTGGKFSHRSQVRDLHFTRDRGDPVATEPVAVTCSVTCSATVADDASSAHADHARRHLQSTYAEWLTHGEEQTQIFLTHKWI